MANVCEAYLQRVQFDRTESGMNFPRDNRKMDGTRSWVHGILKLNTEYDTNTSNNDNDIYVIVIHNFKFNDSVKGNGEHAFLFLFS